jgi:hypothetical protein
VLTGLVTSGVQLGQKLVAAWFQPPAATSPFFCHFPLLMPLTMEPRETDLVLHTPPGRPLEIRLESSPVSGASWRPGTLPPDVTLYQRDVRLISTSVGGIAQQVFLFQAIEPGPHVLLFDLKRPQEPMVRRRRRVVVHVTRIGD